MQMADKFLNRSNQWNENKWPEIWDTLSTLPGSRAEISQKITSEHKSEMANRILELKKRELTILNKNKVDYKCEDLSVRSYMKSFGSEFTCRSIEDYVPIEWHSDLNSNAQFRWDSSLFYTKIKVAPVDGADIKVPRELSRFQHIGLLFHHDKKFGAQEFILEALDWINSNPVRKGVNWASTMDVSLRAINWIWGLSLFRDSINIYPEALNTMINSIYVHGQHIEQNLDYTLENTGNHYLSDIAGLIYIGAAFPQFPESDRWLLFGIQELESEMNREVYPDGGSHEGSTSYHRLVTELFISCASIIERVSQKRLERLYDVVPTSHKVSPKLNDPNKILGAIIENNTILPKCFYTRLYRMVNFTRMLTKPNGLIAQFGDNDSARVTKLARNSRIDSRDHRHIISSAGILFNDIEMQKEGWSAIEEARLISGNIVRLKNLSYVAQSKNQCTHIFPDSGIAILKTVDAWISVTCGPNGLNGLGGHNHNDKLSFELNVYGRDFIVDGGCPSYTGDIELRQRYRSTFAHNTIAIEGKEQDPLPEGIDGLFKLPQKCKTDLRSITDHILEGSHDGYGVEHRRRFIMKNNSLEIIDHLSLDDRKWILFNLDPAISVESISEEKSHIELVLAHTDGTLLNVSIKGSTSAEIVKGQFSEGYGMERENQKIKIMMSDTMLQTLIEW